VSAGISLRGSGNARTHLSEARVEGQVDDDVQRRVGDDEQVGQLAEVELDTAALSLSVRQHAPPDCSFLVRPARRFGPSLGLDWVGKLQFP